MHSTSPRQTSILHSYSQQLIGRESPFSLPDISVSRFLVNTPQGQPLMSANNDPMTYRNSRTSSQANSSLEMVYNDLSASPLLSSSFSRLSGSNCEQSLSMAPLVLHNLGDQIDTSPVPHPPLFFDRHDPRTTTSRSRPGSSGRDSST